MAWPRQGRKHALSPTWGRRKQQSRTYWDPHFLIRDLSWLQNLGDEGPSGATRPGLLEDMPGITSLTVLPLLWAWPLCWALVSAAQGLRAGLALLAVHPWVSYLSSRAKQGHQEERVS